MNTHLVRPLYNSTKVAVHTLILLALVLVLSDAKKTSWGAETAIAADRFAGWEKVVKQTHEASLQARAEARRKVIAKDECWPYKAWGDTMWCLIALYENEKIDAANDRLLKRARAYVDYRKAKSSDEQFLPETTQDISPWAYFAIGDYVRILCFFRASSPQFPGRLKPETEAAMKEALWWFVKTDSKVADASLDNLLVLQGTENHDLNRRPNYYLVASVLKEDPAFRDRLYDDGERAVDHYDAYNQFFREWPRQRARYGMWVEVGSSTYQKYSWPALFNLYELSPDPVVRKRFGMLMDLAFIEEAQISNKGRRGGGRSRAHYGDANWETYKNLLYAPEGIPAGGSHSKVVEASSYQLPAAAILLRKMAFPAKEPFLIQNRVLGELAAPNNHLTADSALVNYAYRTPHYILGSTLQNPALSMASPDGGKATLKYGGISRQNRWSGLLFCDPEARSPRTPVSHHRVDNEMCAIFPEVPKTRGGRPQHPFWSFQHENVLFLQRITPDRNMGSYSTGNMGIRFHGRGLEKVEEGGWIFASNGKAFVAVKFLDGGYEWDETGELVTPTNFDQQHSTTRILMHAGDMDSESSFDTFRTKVLACPLKVEKNRVEYRPAPDGPRLICFRYVVADYDKFMLPRVDGKPIELRPDWTYRSPYLKGSFGEGKIAVTVGPLREVYDFGVEE